MKHFCTLIIGFVLLLGCRNESTTARPSDAKTKEEVPQSVAPTKSQAFVGEGNSTSSASTPSMPMPDSGPSKPTGTGVSWSDPTACAECHPKETERYLRTTMGMSLYSPQSFKPIEDFSDEGSLLTSTTSPLQYRAFIDDQGRFWQEERIPIADFVDRVEVKYVIGSGDHSRGYIGARGNRLVRLPMTWFIQKKTWGFSPGYEGRAAPRFSGEVEAECLFCHNSLTPAVNRNRSRFSVPIKQGIGCERCHGDAASHIRAHRSGKGVASGQPDPTILNPRRVGPEKESEICDQCHLHVTTRVLRDGKYWDSYDPGSPLDEYLTPYVSSASTTFTSTGYAGRMGLSACAKASKTAPRCSDCHNPHTGDTALAQRTACQRCHGDKKGTVGAVAQACTAAEGQAVDAPCADCHMARSGGDDLPHVAFTDHYIRVRPKGVMPRTSNRDKPLIAARDFAGPRIAAQIDLGVAHALVGLEDGDKVQMERAEKLLAGDGLDATHTARSLTLLARIQLDAGKITDARDSAMKAVKKDANDPSIHLLETEIHLVSRQLALAEASAKRALAIDSSNVEAWSLMAQIHQSRNEYQAADVAWGRITKLEPLNSLVVSQRGFNALNAGQLQAAEQLFARALNIDPLNEAAPFGLAPILAQKERLAAAEGLMMQTALLFPKLAPAHLFLARFARARDDVDGAVARYQAAIKHDPTGPTAHVELISLAYEVGQLEAASAWRDRALRAIPDLALPPQIKALP